MKESHRPVFSSALLQPRMVLLPNFIEISQAVCPSGQAGDVTDRNRKIDWDRNAENKTVCYEALPTLVT